MNNRERESLTLNFGKPKGRGAVQETFFPWTLTVERFEREGLPAEVVAGASGNEDSLAGAELLKKEKYLLGRFGKNTAKYEKYLGFDPVYRIHFMLPFRRLDEEIIEETSEYVIRRDTCGRQMIRYTGSFVELEHQPVISGFEEWEVLKKRGDQELERYFTDQCIQRAYGHLVAGHDRGDYSIRLNLEGFFWMHRELLGIEGQMLAFYDEPQLLHDINNYMLKVYQNQLIKVLKLVKPDVVYIMEDLSGDTGPMISLDCLKEFVGDYYKQLFPLMKDAGVGNIFVDTDGEFEMLIPYFMEVGVDGFLPMDVKAGMDIVEIRKKFPTLKFIGGYNKLAIAKGKEAIDKEFERILPVIRLGGYIPSTDHQVAPSTSLEDYRYYISKLREVMEQAGADL
jgi:hypothetical protein